MKIENKFNQPNTTPITTYLRIKEIRTKQSFNSADIIDHRVLVKQENG
jgi:hypothetical protein